MLNITDLSCMGNNGKSVHGTAAVLHRLFGQDDNFDKEARMKEYERIIKECGYRSE